MMSIESIAVELAVRAGMRMTPETALAAVKTMVGDVPDWVLARFMLAARSTGLSLFGGEVYPAVREDGGLDAVVSLDGWVKLVNRHPEFQGVTFAYSPDRVASSMDTHRPHEWVECAITKRGVPMPFVAREYFDEVNQRRGVWLTHPIRATRNAALVQAARYAFGLSGVGAAEESGIHPAAPAQPPAPVVPPAPPTVAAPVAAAAPSGPRRMPAGASVLMREEHPAPTPPSESRVCEPVTSLQIGSLHRLADAIGDADVVRAALEPLGIASIDAIQWVHEAREASDALLSAMPD
ncbi:MAG: phage recombination protein Bet [Pseudomonadota bacterium]|jgi:hypothetical protein